VRRLTAVIPTVALALVAAGCAGQSGSENAKDFRGDEQAVAQVVDDFADAGNSGDDKKICDTLLSRQLVTRLGGDQRCREVVHEQLKDTDVAELDVRKVDVTGSTAKAQVESKFDGDEAMRTLDLVRENNAWRISGLGT